MELIGSSKEGFEIFGLVKFPNIVYIAGYEFSGLSVLLFMIFVFIANMVAQYYKPSGNKDSESTNNED